MKRKIDLYTNEVAGGWSPTDKFLGGGEDSIVLWSEEMVKLGHDVTIYHNPSQPINTHNGVKYRNRVVFQIHVKRDVLITWKDPKPWLLGARAKLALHWSSEVEPGCSVSWHRRLSRLICISDYHLSRLEGLPDGLGTAFPLGIDVEHLNDNAVDTVPNTMLYCSSPDRGLLQLLKDWHEIRKNHPGIELRVTYGWRVFDAVGAGQSFKKYVMEELGQEGITYLGELSKDEMAQEYWKAEYWVLPLQKPDSELFCLNAVKARHCEAMPVVNRVGALQDTVGEWRDYTFFVNGLMTGANTNAKYPIQSWSEVIKQYWEPLFEETGK